MVKLLPSKTRILIIETQPESDQDDLKEIAHDPERDVWDDKHVVDQATSFRCLSGVQATSIDDGDGITHWFSVMRCTLAQPKESDD